MSRDVTLVLVTREGLQGREVLLGRKLRGFGAGKVVAPGGKIEPGESPAAGAARELREETGLLMPAAALEHRATVLFRFPAAPELDMNCLVFAGTGYSGEVRASDELDASWHPVALLPVPGMWQDAGLWLPKVLSGQSFTVTVVMAEDQQSVAGTAYEAWS